MSEDFLFNHYSDLLEKELGYLFLFNELDKAVNDITALKRAANKKVTKRVSKGMITYDKIILTRILPHPLMENRRASYEGVSSVFLKNKINPNLPNPEEPGAQDKWNKFLGELYSDKSKEAKDIQDNIISLSLSSFLDFCKPALDFVEEQLVTVRKKMKDVEEVWGENIPALLKDRFEFHKEKLKRLKIVKTKLTKLIYLVKEVHKKIKKEQDPHEPLSEISSIMEHVLLDPNIQNSVSILSGVASLLLRIATPKKIDEKVNEEYYQIASNLFPDDLDAVNEVQGRFNKVRSLDYIVSTLVKDFNDEIVYIKLLIDEETMSIKKMKSKLSALSATLNSKSHKIKDVKGKKVSCTVEKTILPKEVALELQIQIDSLKEQKEVLDSKFKSASGIINASI